MRASKLAPAASSTPLAPLQPQLTLPVLPPTSKAAIESQLDQSRLLNGSLGRVSRERLEGILLIAFCGIGLRITGEEVKSPSQGVSFFDIYVVMIIVRELVEMRVDGI